MSHVDLVRFNARDYPGGWVVGAFTPAVFHSDEFEFAVKFFLSGEREGEHFQISSTEITIVIAGTCRIGAEDLSPGEGILIPPGVSASFEAYSDVALAVVKMPSLPSDKVEGAGAVSHG